jgi:hypothetical protein
MQTVAFLCVVQRACAARVMTSPRDGKFAPTTTTPFLGITLSSHEQISDAPQLRSAAGHDLDEVAVPPTFRMAEAQRQTFFLNPILDASKRRRRSILLTPAGKGVRLPSNFRLRQS